MKAYGTTRKTTTITKSTKKTARQTAKININMIEKERKAPNFIAKRAEHSAHYPNRSAGNFLMAEFDGMSDIAGLCHKYKAFNVPQSTRVINYCNNGHPYGGIADDLGSLARYQRSKNYSTALSREWVYRFIVAGGGFDSNGVYGLFPFASSEHEKHWAEDCSPEAVAKHVELFGRLDWHEWSGVGSNFKERFENMISITEKFSPSTRAEWHRAHVGVERKKKILEFAEGQADFNRIASKSELSFGWMSHHKFAKWCFRNIKSEKCVSDGVNLWYKGVCLYSSYEDIPIIEHLEEHPKRVQLLVNQFESSLERKIAIRIAEPRWKLAKTVFAARKIMTANEPVMSLDSYRKWYVEHTTTSVGPLACAKDRIFSRNGEIETRRKGDCVFFKEWGVWFAFKSGAWEYHVEGETLREALATLNSRNEKGGLRFSLNDVRNDKKGTAAFCLAGTKSFLANRMPFVYNLISEYKEWSDIPEEIMCQNYELATHDIFNGYPHP